ncbi:phage virion morphogenesis protein [Sodalis sp. dw_96]|uniref:phage virion morphogenesis protein n=1 Tax=Sodalis sp. dw_96 TaxID=2719794 RepID=UPI002104102A|nr:phage virion morphogenesis protein [Sodalis sp. dw_96]
MFTKLCPVRFMKAKVTAITAEVTIAGGAAQRIAQIHHYGSSDRVWHRGIIVRYPERHLFGFEYSKENILYNMLIDYLIE